MLRGKRVGNSPAEAGLRTVNGHLCEAEPLDDDRAVRYFLLYTYLYSYSSASLIQE